MAKPLPLTPFERCMLWSDRDDYPCLCIGRVLLEGQLDRQAFESALLKTLEYHWLLRATVSHGRRKRWIVRDASLPPIEWQQGPTGRPLPPAPRIDLDRETGLRGVVVQDSHRVELTLQMHHACCDGAGLLRFFEDLLSHYATEQSGFKPATAVPPVDPQRLQSRGRYGFTMSKALKILPRQSVGLIGALQFWRRQPESLSLPQTPGTMRAEAVFPSSTTLEVSSQNTVELRKAARRRNVSLNELLARDFFLALWDWQAAYGVREDQAWLRMMIPINMRDKSHATLPAMNAVSSIFLDRRPGDVEDETQLLHSIRDEMEIIRRFDLRYTFLLSLWLMQWIPGALRRSATNNGRTISVIFSNAGKLFRRCKLPRIDGFHHAGNLKVLDIDGLAPITSQTAATLFAFEYNKRLKLNLHFDPRVISDAQAGQLLQIFLQRTVATTATNT
ncbi:acyltransferase PapA5 [Rosistilla carotiformis]|uniref:Acyltransferase PapA5 n=1 Tax=Rosistilla carotiformis TaxID=2528017 RepID=A0A518K130_9BACT|nr:hypothetical protein [Rosistilla carotiformis]QDV71504.1 acyltransferase PapA5 [Rosistilla carotiformis]